MQNKIYHYNKWQQIKLKPKLKDEFKMIYTRLSCCSDPCPNLDISFTLILFTSFPLVFSVFHIFHCCFHWNAVMGLVGGDVDATTYKKKKKNWKWLKTFDHKKKLILNWQLQNIIFCLANSVQKKEGGNTAVFTITNTSIRVTGVAKSTSLLCHLSGTRKTGNA